MLDLEGGGEGQQLTGIIVSPPFSPFLSSWPFPLLLLSQPAYANQHEQIPSFLPQPQSPCSVSVCPSGLYSVLPSLCPCVHQSPITPLFHLHHNQLTTTLLPGDAKDARDEVYDGTPHESKLSHELIGSAAAFEGMRLWEQHQRKEGKTVNHGVAKELLAAAVGFEVDKLVETKGLDFVDRERAKHHAKQQAEHLYDEHYGREEHYDP